MLNPKTERAIKEREADLRVRYRTAYPNSRGWRQLNQDIGEVLFGVDVAFEVHHTGRFRVLIADYHTPASPSVVLDSRQLISKRYPAKKKKKARKR